MNFIIHKLFYQKIPGFFKPLNFNPFMWVWYSLIGRGTYGIHFLYIIKRQNFEGANETKKKKSKLGNVDGKQNSKYEF